MLERSDWVMATLHFYACMYRLTDSSRETSQADSIGEQICGAVETRSWAHASMTSAALLARMEQIRHIGLGTLLSGVPEENMDLEGEAGLCCLMIAELLTPWSTDTPSKLQQAPNAIMCGGY